ncbi:MAG: ATP-binding cassette domain-containing protein [Clostridiales bacterium]|jgi:ABC-2 type transport system ATP-binding protein|nr:ATP-binding cassette domain-containing protein [Clostridiales bacterium]
MIISVENLNKQFVTYNRGHSLRSIVNSVFARKEKIVHALNDISFCVEEGELVGFLGPNGAGKSTTLKILTGILHPTSGNVDVMGYVPWKDRKKFVAKIGAVFGQKSQLFSDVPPIDAFYLNKAIYNIPTKLFNGKLNLLVEILDVGDIVKKPTRQLSLGERMKCEFIMAMLHDPKIVFLDEPTIGLDVIARQKIREFILEMNKKGTTFILTTHDIADIEYLAKRVIVIKSGDIVFDNTIQSLKHKLGNIKLISVTLHGELPEINHPGIKIINNRSDVEADIAVDCDIIDIGDCINLISEKSKIKDINIKDLPIENAIIDLYKN